MTDNGDDLAPEETPGYKAPTMKKVDEIQQLDADDESLQKYKRTLLEGAGVVPRPEDPRNVIVSKLIIMVDGRPDVELDLEGDLKALKEKSILMKEGVSYKVKIAFFVQREIVSGLKYIQGVYRKGIRVDKDDCMVGSYGPKGSEQYWVNKSEEAPKGMIARGTYKMKSKFIDDDKNVHLEWEWQLKIVSNWDSVDSPDAE